MCTPHAIVSSYLRTAVASRFGTRKIRDGRSVIQERIQSMGSSMEDGNVLFVSEVVWVDTL